jgi:GNAT superfamily N-acetyltransferase
MTLETLVTTYLAMNDPSDFTPAYVSDPALQIMQCVVPLAGYYRFLYGEVGRAWNWLDRDEWSDEQLEAHLAAPTISVWVLHVNGTPAGYIELDAQTDGTEIAYFGLIARFFGRGYGKHLLSFGIQRAWDAGAYRVWVHTCNMDGPHALENYQKRGFTVYDIKQQPMPEKYKLAN